MMRKILFEIRRTIHVEGASEASFLQKLFVLFFAYGLHSLIIFRFGKALHTNLSEWWAAPVYYPCLFVQQILRLITEKMYGIYIDAQAEIGDGFYIGHFGDIKIGRCEIGKGCSVHQMVSIGICPEDIDRNGNVVIGDNVWIGGHSLIQKGVSVGNGATIVVGSRVVTDVKPYAMVMGNPARVIKNNFDNSSLFGGQTISSSP